jgi:hypothetical protein
MVDASERLQVLLTQEDRIYRTKDYISRMQQCVDLMDADAPVSSDDGSSPESPSKKRKSPVSIPDNSPNRESLQPGANSTDGSSNSQINKHWREKICEWAYQGKLNSATGRPCTAVYN